MAGITSVASQATSVTLLAESTSGARVVAINNTDANTLYIGYDVATVTTAAYTAAIAANGLWESPLPIRGGIVGIWAADGAGQANITEFET